MQVFKTYFLVLRKYKGFIFLYFAVFMVLALVMTKLQASEGQKTFSESSVDVALIDEDEGGMEEAFKDYFGERVRFSEWEDDRKEIAEALYWRDIDYVLVIPKGFAQSLQKGEEAKELSCMKIPGDFQAVYFESELQLYMQKLKALIGAGYSMEDAGEELARLAEEQTQVEIASFVNKNQHDSSTRFFLYVPYLFISVGVVGIGMVMHRLNAREVKRRTECGPTPLSERNVGITAAIIVFGMILFIGVLVIAAILSGGSILTDKRLPWFALNIFAMLAFGMSLGFFTGTVVRNREAINGIVNVAGLALCFLGGIFVPREFFGKGVTMVAKFFPTYWYVVNNDAIGGMAKVTGKFVRDTLVQTGLIFVYAVAIFAITLVVISAKRRSAE